MQFNRKALIQAAEWSLDRQRQVWEERQQDLVVKMDEERQRWTEEHAGKWLTAAQDILAKLRKDEPIVENDLPRDRGFIAYFKPQRHPTRGEYKEDGDLRALINVLNTVEDDTVSMNALKNLGFGQRTMSNIVHSMAVITSQQKASA